VEVTNSSKRSSFLRFIEAVAVIDFQSETR